MSVNSRTRNFIRYIDNKLDKIRQGIIKKPPIEHLDDIAQIYWMDAGDHGLFGLVIVTGEYIGWWRFRKCLVTFDSDP